MMNFCMAKDASEPIRNAFPDAEWFIIVPDGKLADFRTPITEIQTKMRQNMQISFELSSKLIDGKRIYVGRKLDPLVASLGIGYVGRG